MYIDGTLFSMRIDGSIEKVPVLWSSGLQKPDIGQLSGCSQAIRNQPPAGGRCSRISKDGGLMQIESSLGSWMVCLALNGFSRRSLPKRKCSAARYSGANVLAKVPKKLKKNVADQVRSIFYASSLPLRNR